MKLSRQFIRTELIRGHWPFALALLFALLPFGAGPQGAAEGSGLRQLILVAIFLSAAFAIVRFPDRYPSLVRSMPLTLLLLLVYIFLSVAWSPEWYVSLKRAIQVLGVFVVAVALSVGGNGRPRVASVAAWVMLAGMFLSIIWALLFFDNAFADNGFRGITANKNTFGQYAGLCILVGFSMMQAESGLKGAKWLGLLVLGLIGLALSRSAASIVAVIFVAGAYFWFFLSGKIHRSWVPALSVAAMLLIFSGFMYFIVNGASSLESFALKALSGTGKDITLSGRTYLWELIWNEAMRHAWFGVGYGGFWLGLEGMSGQIAYQVKWGYPGQAHNGYLDLFNELGMIGCLLVAAFILEHARNVWRLMDIDRKQGLFHASLIALVLVLNLAEATLLRTTHLCWVIFAASVFEVSSLVKKGPVADVRARSSLGFL